MASRARPTRRAGDPVTLVGGSGRVGMHLTSVLLDAGRPVFVVDRRPPEAAADSGVSWVSGDLLTDDVTLPAGQVVLLLGAGDPTPRWPWTVPLDVALTTARLLPRLTGRRVLVAAPTPPGWGTVDQLSETAEAALRTWCEAALRCTRQPSSPWRVAPLCREFVDLADTSIGLSLAEGHVLLLAQRAQEILLESAQTAQLRVLRSRHIVYEVARQLLGARAHQHLRSSGESDPACSPPIPVVVPPRPVLPDVVADRQQEALWTGRLKPGNRWTAQLTDELRATLNLAEDDTLLATTSGTTALRLGVLSVVGPARPGDVAVLPSFTFRATVDVLLQLGYTLRYVDVDSSGWTMDPTALSRALSAPGADRVKVVVCVDTFGNPCSYEGLLEACLRRGVPLVADSAAGFGSTYAGEPIGSQAAAHAFSMSFAKVLTAGGAGGAVVIRGPARTHDVSGWLASSLMTELHAIAALDQLAVLPDLVDRRNAIADVYRRATETLGGVVEQGVATGNRHSYVHWVLCTPARQELAESLERDGVQTKPYFPAQHLHHDTGAAVIRLPVTERLDAQALALPMSSELTARHAARVADAVVRGYFGLRRRQRAARSTEP
jgi:dTDP-4-amino-4,6-dideoxygalactose transaminase